MSETIKQLIKQKKEVAEISLDHAREIAAEIIAEATKKAEKMISYHEGKVDLLKDMETLDWDYYAENQLRTKK